MGGFIQTLEDIGSNPLVMKWAGLIVLALLGFGFMRLRRHPMRSAAAFAAGILGIGVLASIIQYIF